MFKQLHPSRAQLFEHAESLLARHVPFSSEITRHVAACNACKSELAAIRDSLELIQQAQQLQPSRDAKAAILLAAKTQRSSGALPLNPDRPARRLARGMAVAASFLVVSAVLFRSSTDLGLTGLAQGQPSTDQEVQTAGLTLETLRQVSPEEELLGAALMSSAWAPQTRWERAQRRELLALDDDIEKALEALKDNPALVRASDLVTTNRQRKKETLRALYVNRDL